MQEELQRAILSTLLSKYTIYNDLERSRIENIKFEHNMFKAYNYLVFRAILAHSNKYYTPESIYKFLDEYNKLKENEFVEIYATSPLSVIILEQELSKYEKENKIKRIIL